MSREEPFRLKDCHVMACDSLLLGVGRVIGAQNTYSNTEFGHKRVVRKNDTGSRSDTPLTCPKDLELKNKPFGAMPMDDHGKTKRSKARFVLSRVL